MRGLDRIFSAALVVAMVISPLVVRAATQGDGDDGASIEARVPTPTPAEVKPPTSADVAVPAAPDLKLNAAPADEKPNATSDTRPSAPPDAQPSTAPNTPGRRGGCQAEPNA